MSEARDTEKCRYGKELSAHDCVNLVWAVCLGVCFAAYWTPKVCRQDLFALHVVLESPPGLLQCGFVSCLPQLPQNQPSQQSVQVTWQHKHHVSARHRGPQQEHSTGPSRLRKGPGFTELQYGKYHFTQIMSTVFQKIFTWADMMIIITNLWVTLVTPKYADRKIAASFDDSNTT